MKTALLVIDMQNVFLSMTSTALPHIESLIAHFHSTSLPILFTQHGHTKEELTPPFKNQLVRRWGASGSIAIGTPDWELIPAIERLVGGAEIVGKNTYDAFINTSLEDMLREKGVGRVVVCGVMTDFCCDTTARAAFNRGFETWLVSDACGSADEVQHREGLKAFGKGYAEILDSKEVMERIR